MRIIMEGGNWVILGILLNLMDFEKFCMDLGQFITTFNCFWKILHGFWAILIPLMCPVPCRWLPPP